MAPDTHVVLPDSLSPEVTVASLVEVAEADTDLTPVAEAVPVLD